MPPQTFGLVLHSAMAMCALMAVVNALRYKKRGVSAYALSAAFVALGFTIWVYSIGATRWVEAGLAITGLLLVAEFGLRAARQGDSR